MQELEASMTMYIDPKDVGCEDTLGGNNGVNSKRYDRMPGWRRRRDAGEGGEGKRGETEALQEAVEEYYGNLGEVQERGMTIILGDPNLPIVYV